MVFLLDSLDWIVEMADVFSIIYYRKNNFQL